MEEDLGPGSLREDVAQGAHRRRVSNVGAWCSDLLGDHVALALSPGLEVVMVSTFPGCWLGGTGR